MCGSCETRAVCDVPPEKPQQMDRRQPVAELEKNERRRRASETSLGTLQGSKEKGEDGQEATTQRVIRKTST